jgi:hypothetical protein
MDTKTYKDEMDVMESTQIELIVEELEAVIAPAAVRRLR